MNSRKSDDLILSIFFMALGAAVYYLYFPVDSTRLVTYWMAYFWPVSLIAFFLYLASMNMVRYFKPGSKAGKILDKSVSNLRAVVYIAVILAIALVPRWYITKIQISPFKDHISEYINFPELKTPEIKKGADLHINGKMITIDKNNNEIDPLYLKLPVEMQAKSPDDVGTVVWLEWNKTQVGNYTDGSKGYQYTCNVTVIDKTQGAVIDKKFFLGSEPPTGHPHGSGDQTGNRPADDVVSYLSNSNIK